MPFIINDNKEAQCPRCYEGVIVCDYHSGRLYCERCGKTIKVRVIRHGTNPRMRIINKIEDMGLQFTSNGIINK